MRALHDREKRFAIRRECGRFPARVQEAAGRRIGAKPMRLPGVTEGQVMNHAEFLRVRDRYAALAMESAPGSIVAKRRRVRDVMSPVFLSGTWSVVQKVERYMPRGGRLLDYGCGAGSIAVFLETSGYDVVGIDVDEKSFPAVSVDGYRADDIVCHLPVRDGLWARLSHEFGVAFQTFDGKRIPFEDGHFAGVMLHAVYEHVSPGLIPSLIAEVTRVLVEGGFLFLFRTPRRLSYAEPLARALGIRSHELTYDEADVVASVSSCSYVLKERGVMEVIPSFAPLLLPLSIRLPRLFVALDRLLLHTPLKRFAHHMSLVFQKAAAVSLYGTGGTQ